MKKRKIMTVMLTAVLIIAMLSTGTLSVFSAVDVPTQNRIPEWAVLDGKDNRSLASTSANLPASYDLRDEGVVTPVKLQSPWDSCWAFGGIAAAEISILSALGKTYEENPLDLSERHLAYFAHKAITADENPSQAGEGLHMTDPSENAEFNGGDFGLISSIFSQGVGPVEESLFPYRGSAATYNENGWYSDTDDWSIPAADETGSSNRLLNSGFVLKDGNILPEYWDANKTHFSYGVNAIKQELLNGHGVAIKYRADRSGKYAVSDSQNQAYFYGQYTFDDLSTNHDACIVGWDDNYDAVNFSHTTDINGSALTDKEDTPLSEEAAAALTTPPGNGAWIVKNSWGSETDCTVDDLGNPIGLSPVGIPDNNGQASGYFYLSYYDKTICGAETMNFSASLSDAGQLAVMQYDYLPSQTQRFRFDDDEKVMSSANVFCADEPIELRSVSTATDKANMRVTFAIYRLNDNFQNPTDGELLYRTSQNFEYAGFHRLDLDQPLVLATGQRISIVSTASVVNESGKRIYSVAANQSITEEGAHQYNKPTYGVAVVNQGESYLYQNGTWVDWKDKLTALRTQGTINEYQCIDNFSIKAYVVPAEETPSPDDPPSPDEPQTATQPQPGSDIQPATPHEHLPLTAHPKVPATCGQAGTKAYWECEECHKLFSDANGYGRIYAPVVIPATDNHTYGDPVWTWTNDLSAATATFTCCVCGDFHDEEGEVVPQPSDDKTEYTASVTFGGQTYTDKKVVDTTPLYAIHTDGNVDVYRWDGWAVESITFAGGGDEVSIALKENAVPDAGKYFTGEYLVNGTSLGREGTDPWSGYISCFEVPDQEVTVTAVQADKEALTVDLRSGAAVALSYDAFLLLVSDERFSKLYPDEGNDILFDLGNSGVPDVRLYYTEERDKDGVVTAITYYAVKAKDADAVGRRVYDYTGNTVPYTAVGLLLSGDVIRGDADGNGQVTILDATIIQRRIAGFTGSSFVEEAADADGNGQVTILDATAIQRWLASFTGHENIGQPMT